MCKLQLIRQIEHLTLTVYSHGYLFIYQFVMVVFCSSPGYDDKKLVDWDDLDEISYAVVGS